MTALQVSPRLLGIANNEKLNLDGGTVYKIATMANGDIRQMLNMMQMYNVSNKHMKQTDAEGFAFLFFSFFLFSFLSHLFLLDYQLKNHLLVYLMLYLNY